MKFVLGAFMLCTLSAFANQPSGPELGTVEAWSPWYSSQQEIQLSQVCGEVLAHFHQVNATRPYDGVLEDEMPVGYKHGTQPDGQSYFALSCRIRVYRAPSKGLLSQAQ